MVIGGIVLNIDEHSLYNRIKNGENVKKVMKKLNLVMG